jgi:cystathionine beta-lyase/cystathionine gamma-synthase
LEFREHHEIARRQMRGFGGVLSFAIPISLSADATENQQLIRAISEGVDHIDSLGSTWSTWSMLTNRHFGETARLFHTRQVMTSVALMRAAAANDSGS